MSQDCVHLGAPEVGKTQNGLQVHTCRIHGHCTPAGRGRGIAGCHGCRDKLILGSSGFAARWQDPLQVCDARHNATESLRHLLQGGVAFMVCGGPSTKSLPLGLLNQRGCWSLCVNNSAAYEQFRPQAFVCSDPPSKFCHQIWLDAGIMKFVPKPKLGGNRSGLRRKLPEAAWHPCGRCGATGKVIDKDKEKKCPACVRGTVMFVPLTDAAGNPIRTTEAPNVWGFGRRSWLVPDDTFFLDAEAAWGNQNSGVLRTGGLKTVNTMLLGMRLLYYLGARRIYLVGVDFHMDPTLGAYGFPEGKSADGFVTNNSQFEVCNAWLCQMAATGVFERFGVEFYNTNKFSGLRAFPHVPFEVAIADATAGLGPIDTRDWYDK